MNYNNNNKINLHDRFMEIEKHELINKGNNWKTLAEIGIYWQKLEYNGRNWNIMAEIAI
jgi:hypothetical protein